jgi:hypothetical protein
MPEKIQKFAHFIAFFGIFFSVVFVPYLRRTCALLYFCLFHAVSKCFLLVFQAKFRSELKSFEKYFFVLLLS